MADPEAPDPLAPYRDLKGRSARGESGPWAICEGANLVDAALRAAAEGGPRVVSLLVAPDQAAAWAPRLPAGADLLVRPVTELQGLVGFAFHRGVLACLAPPAEGSLDALRACGRLLVLPRLHQAENLGLLLRTAAALGLDGALLGSGASPWSRRAVRTSMGGVFRLPLWRREDPSGLLAEWRQAGGEVVAAALGPGSADARTWVPAPRTALVLGPEDQGLDAAWLARADRRVALPMRRGMDSLNVAAAGAILMDRLCANT